MQEDRLIELLEKVKRGDVSCQDAVAKLRALPFEDLGFAKVDHHRALRTGFPEVIFCQGKTPEQIRRIARCLLGAQGRLLATRADRDAFEAIAKVAPDAEYHETARIVVVDKGGRKRGAGVGSVVVMAAGTADLPVAEEAAVTAETMGAAVDRLFDVGVSGLHRLLAYREQLHGANAIVAVAGMEGALPSIVGGLVGCPVIAVPTSVGYGASFGGVAALLTMLNSCAAGVSVVNIDNGFGGGFMAALINAMAKTPARSKQSSKGKHR